MEVNIHLSSVIKEFHRKMQVGIPVRFLVSSSVSFRLVEFIWDFFKRLYLSKLLTQTVELRKSRASARFFATESVCAISTKKIFVDKIND